MRARYDAPMARPVHLLPLATVLALLTGCSGLGGGPRPATSTLGCARAAVAAVVEPTMTDKRMHCTGAASIARLCSVFEAHTAAWGKEFTDLFGAGDPSVADLHADRDGIACARRDPRPEAVLECCAAHGW